MCWYFDCRLELALWAAFLVCLMLFIVWTVAALQRRYRLAQCAKGNHVKLVSYSSRFYTTYKCECGKVDLMQHHDRSF